MKTYELKLSSAVAIAGRIHRAGEVVSVDEEAAKNLLHRGKAELANETNAPAQEAAPAADADADQDANANADDKKTDATAPAAGGKKAKK